MARVRKDIEADLALRDASIVSLFSEGTGSAESGMKGPLATLHRMIFELEARLAVVEQKTLERLGEMERRLDYMEARIDETGEQSLERGQALERSLVALAERIRRLEPR